MTTSSSQKRADLKRLSKLLKANIFEMLRIADELLGDAEYVDQFGGEVGLMEHMEKEEFSHFGGSPSIGSLIRAYRASPKKATWQEYKFDVWAMIDLASPTKDAGESQRINWKAMYKELELKCKALEEKIVQQEAIITELRASNTDLRSKCERLIADNGELRGRVAVLERFGRHALGPQRASVQSTLPD